MSWLFKLLDTAGSYQAGVDSNNRVKANLADATAPNQVGGIRLYSENDAGSISGTAYLQSPETDDDCRIRVGHEALFDCETFNYTAQNTGKHIYRNTTMTNVWATSGLTTNSGNITTTTTGSSFQTWAELSLIHI